MTPQHVKMLLGALKDNLEKYEAKFGQVNINGELQAFQPPKPKTVN